MSIWEAKEHNLSYIQARVRNIRDIFQTESFYIHAARSFATV